MALLFSAVTVTAGNEEIEFTVAIPPHPSSHISFRKIPKVCWNFAVLRVEAGAFLTLHWLKSAANDDAV